MVLLRHKPWSWLTLKCTPVFILFLIFFFVGLKWNLSPGTAAYCNVCMSVHCRHWRDKAWNGHIGQMDTHTHTHPTHRLTHSHIPTHQWHKDTHAHISTPFEVHPTPHFPPMPAANPGHTQVLGLTCTLRQSQSQKWDKTNCSESKTSYS